MSHYKDVLRSIVEYAENCDPAAASLEVVLDQIKGLAEDGIKNAPLMVGSPFTVEDILTYDEGLNISLDLTEQEAEDFLRRHGSNIADLMTERGWEAIDTLFGMDFAERIEAAEAKEEQ